NLGPEDLAIAAPGEEGNSFFLWFGEHNNPPPTMDTVDPIFALVAVNPLLAAVVLPVYFALSVWSTHRVVHFLHSWSATQTAKRCDRWTQECEGAPASSWWQRRLVPFIFPSQTYRSNFCRDVEKFEVCPKYAQELRLMTTSAAAASEDATPESASAFSNAHHTAKGDSPCPVNLGTTIRKGTGKAWREIRATVKRVGAVAKCAWSQAREKVYTTVLKKTGTRPTIGSGSAGGGSGSSNSFLCVHSPAPPRKAASHEDRILAAQRALRGSDTAGAVRLAFGLNTSFFVIAGLRFYLLKSRGGRLRSREWRRRWRRWQQRGNGGNRGGMVVRGDAAHDNGSSTVGDFLLQARDSVAAASRRLRASEPCLSWGDWDDASLRSFMAEEARTSSHPAQRLLQLEEFHHHAALPRLARQWNVPFLSKVGVSRIFCGRGRQHRLSTTSSPFTGRRCGSGSTAKGYSHFLQLWEDVCQTHDGVRDFAFPSTGAVSSARGAFSEVLGEKRLEEQRRAKFCELLDVLMKLEPRPPALRHFLAPWPTEGTASSSGSPGLARDRRNREGHQQQGRAREEHGGSWAGTRTPKNRGGGGSGGGAGGSDSAAIGGIGLNGRVSDTRRKDQRQQLLLGGIAVGGLPVTPDRAPRNDRNRGSTSTNRQAGVAAHTEATGTAEEQSAVPLPRDLRLWVFLAFVGVLEACAALRAVGVTALSLPVTLALTAIAPAVAAVAFSVSSHARSWPSQLQRWQQQGRRKLSRPPQVDADSGGVLRGRETSGSFGRLPRQSHSLGGVAAAAAAAVGLGGLFGGGSGAGAGAGAGAAGEGSSGGGADRAGLGGVGAAAAVGLGAPGGTRRRSDTSSSPTRGRAPRGARRRSPARPSVGRREGECVNERAAGTSSPPAKTAVGGVRAVAVTVPSGIAQELQME
ncbi:unnamed protein product, partial [Ectocarpus fasciculatus]